MPLFSDHDIEHSYSDSKALHRIQNLIIEHSTNHEDIRDIAFAGIDFNKVHHILDLGCAFGYSISGLKGKILPDTHIVGFDLQESYQKPFLESCRKIGASGEFHISDVAHLASFPARSFDLVTSSFSMYFFPDTISHVATVLKQGGTFVAITHSEEILRELIQHIPASMNRFGVKMPELLCIQKLFREFSCENGCELLQPHFEKIQKHPFINRLHFEREDLGKFIDYVEMKKHLFLKEAFEIFPDNVSAVLEDIMGIIALEAKEKGWIDFNKNDCIFSCKKPIHRKKRQHRQNTPARYCNYCGNSVSGKKIEGRQRGFCSSCGNIVYENPLPVAAAIVTNKAGDVLLVRRANHPMRGMWCLPCGFSEIDEDIKETALRELHEETGLVGKNGKLVDASNSRNFFYGNLLVVTYHITGVEGELAAGDDAIDAQFFPVKSLPILAFPSHQKALDIFSAASRNEEDDTPK